MKNKHIFNLNKFAQFQAPIFEGAEQSIAQEPQQNDYIQQDNEDSEQVDMSDLDGNNLLSDSSNLPNNDLGESNESFNFKNHIEFYNFLKKSFESNNQDSAAAFDEIWNGKLSSVLGDSDGATEVEDGLKRFFSADLESEDAVDLADDIFSLYSSAIGPKIEPTMIEKEASKIIEDMIKRSRESLYRISDYITSKMLDSTDESSGLKKEAQHKSMENIFYYGPESVSISPFTNGIQSGMHRVEQNKGFGLVLDDIKDLDYESIWRQNVMDKYTQPYRDEDGNYVGGTINKRFEVNSNVDPINNMQLLPGTRHRPYIPELGSTEARMEVARGNKDKLSDPFTFSNIDLSFSDVKKKS